MSRARAARELRADRETVESETMARACVAYFCSFMIDEISEARLMSPHVQ